MVRSRLQRDGRGEAAVTRGPDVAEHIWAREHVHRDPAVWHRHSVHEEVGAGGEAVGRRIDDLELRQRRERRELVVHVTEERADERDDQHRNEDHGPEDEAVVDDRAIRLEGALRGRLRRAAATFLLVQHDELVRF